LYDNIPAGTSYVTGSTILNGAPVADVGGNMPFANTGNLIQSPAYGPGILAPNVTATLTFRVRVTANGGNITNYAIIQGTHSGITVTQNTNTVFTNLTPDPTCSVIYQSVASTQSGTPQQSPSRPYRVIKTLNTANGTAGPTLYDGATGPCFNAITGAALPAGSVLTYSSAIAYDKASRRIYFVNNSSSSVQDLCYIDMNTTPVSAKRFPGYPLETTTGTGWNINRMSFASDGFGYAITESGSDIIRFSMDAAGLPVIVRMGALINDGNNGANDILAEKGGDIFGDGSGNLYLVANSSNLYKINPNTRIATFLGSVNPFPGTSNSIAVDAAGNVYIGGAYQNVFTVNLATMNGASITGGNTSNVWTNGDYTSCAFPVLAPALTANKSFTNLSGHPGVVGGDTVEYRIEVMNTGNINAAGVKLYDSIPSSTTYIPGTTRMNGVPVADAGGLMPFSLPGGRLVNSTGEQPGIIKPGAAFRVIVTFRAVAQPLQLICNQVRVTLFDVNGNTMFINSNDPSQGPGQNPTCFYSSGVLPAGNLAVRGSLNQEKSLVQWTVTAERDVAAYEVEYATDGIHFTSVGQVPATSTGEAVKHYQLLDEVNTAADKRFYRVRVLGVNGNYTYSTVIRLTLAGLDVIRIQPNPFERYVNLQLQSKNGGQLRLRLVDFSGREVLRTTEQLNKGVNTININVPAGLTTGAYVLELVTGEGYKYQQKLMKR
jgi:uncharacterized repeat protein (TIGR01451 family)